MLALLWGDDVPPRPAVPPELSSAPFSGSVAVARGLLTRKQLRSRCWVRLLRDVYVHSEVVLDPAMRIEALRHVVRPGRVVIGRTAAWLHGAWTPYPGSPVPLEVSDPATTNGGDVAGLGRRRLTLRDAHLSGLSWLDHDVELLDGLEVTSPWRTCFDLMRERALVEAVVVADAFAYTGAIDVTRMAVYAADRVRWPRVRAVRVALNLAVHGARSPGESRLRMVVVLAGLPEPLVNVPLLDRTERLLGIPDLTVVGPRSATGLEYDGAYHEAAEQRAPDRRRENGVTALGGIPLLRYDRESVRTERHVIVKEVTAITGLRQLQELVPADFRRPPPARAW